MLEEMLDYSELIEWAEFLDWEYAKHDKQDYYLAQIAGMLSGKKNAEVKDFLLKFETGKGSKQKPMKLNAQEQINIFKGLFGIKE